MRRPASLLSLPWERPRLSRFVAFVFGCLATTAFAPFGWYPVLPLVLLAFLHGCRVMPPRDAGRHGFWFGFGMFLAGTYWIYISVVVFGQAPAWIAVLLMLGLVLVMAFWLWLAAWLISRLANDSPWRLVAVAPAVWIVVEWLRGWVLSGFPWLAAGYGLIDSPLAGWAPVTGVYGVSAMLVMSVAAALVALSTGGGRRWIAVGIVIAPWILGGVLKSIAWTEPTGERVVATLIQGGIPQDRKWLPEQFRPTLDFYRDATRQVAGSDIVIWPEVAIPSVTDLVEDYVTAIEGDARRAGQTVLFGILERVTEADGQARIYNSVVAVGGESRQTYRKRHLVPFGEYFPVPDTVREWMRMLSLPHSDLSAGADEQPLIAMASGTKLATMICYEDAYAAEQLYALPDAGLLVNVSNDAWFGDSIAPHQHLQIARMRSLETGRSAIRSTNTGVSAFIQWDGAVAVSGAQFEPVIKTAILQPRRGATPYVAAGNLPVILVSLLIIAGFWLRSRAS